MSKLKPTNAMIELRKSIAQQELARQEEQNAFHQKAGAERQEVQRRLEKLKKKRDLAAEAAIGYGLAVKAVEESIRTTEDELERVLAEIREKQPVYQSLFGKFKAEFGYNETDIDWSLKPEAEDGTIKSKRTAPPHSRRSP